MTPAMPATRSRPEQTFFQDPVLDRLMGVTMALAAEVHVLRERVSELEAARPSTDTECRESAAAFAARVLEPLLGEQASKGPL